MNQKLKNIKDIHSGQFQYLDRWVDKKTFRAFVYDKNGNEKLADTYDEFLELTSSGIWFDKKPEITLEITPKTRKTRDVICSAS